MSAITRDRTSQKEPLTDEIDLLDQVEEVVNATPVVDVHTHLFAPQFGDMGLFGIDELLTYHYLIAETFRSSDVTPERFWQMSKGEQADLVWKTLFVENTPLSEAGCGIVTVLTAFGLDPSAPDLSEARAFFAAQKPTDHIDRVLRMSSVTDVVMTNDPFDPQEARVWERSADVDPRFHAAFRMDRLLNDWQKAVSHMAASGYRVDEAGGAGTANEVRRFLDKWIALMKPLYMAVSLPDTFTFPADDVRDWALREIVLPTAKEHKLALTLMVGVRRAVNPELRSAGDGVGRADVGALERICVENPDVRFLATFLSRENQHELCVAARKFSNLMPFGCWWFLNNPSIVREITTERLEMLGPSFIAQHSDARILEQLVYKWPHARRTIADSLFESYARLLESGRAVTVGEIQRDAARLLSGNFGNWVGLPSET